MSTATAATAAPSEPKPYSIVGDKRTTIPCKLVTFNNVRRVPGDDAAKRVHLGAAEGEPGARWTITWLRADQVFEITHYPAGRGRKSSVGYVSLASVESFEIIEPEAK